MVPQRVKGWQLPVNMKAFGLSVYQEKHFVVSEKFLKIRPHLHDGCESLWHSLRHLLVSFILEGFQCVCSEAALTTNPVSGDNQGIFFKTSLLLPCKLQV